MDKHKVAKELVMVARALVAAPVKKEYSVSGSGFILIVKTPIGYISTGSFSKLARNFKSASNRGKKELNSDVKTLGVKGDDVGETLFGKEAFFTRDDIMNTLSAMRVEDVAGEDIADLGYKRVSSF